MSSLIQQSRDQFWDYRKSENLRIASLYRELGFDGYANRLQDCSTRLRFVLGFFDLGTNQISERLVAANFCRVRFCPICQWRRSQRWRAKLLQVLPSLLDLFPEYSWLFLTLTIRNVPIEQMRFTTDQLTSAFAKWTKRVSWPADGWIRSVEVVRSKAGEAHPHLHVLLLVPPSYFQTGYKDQAQWINEWQSVLGVDYRPSVRIRGSLESPESAVPELLKYQTKLPDLLEADWLAALTVQLAGQRAISPGGVLRLSLRDVGSEPEDLIGLDPTSLPLSGVSADCTWNGDAYESSFGFLGQPISAEQVPDYVM